MNPLLHALPSAWTDHTPAGSSAEASDSPPPTPSNDRAQSSHNRDPNHIPSPPAHASLPPPATTPAGCSSRAVRARSWSGSTRRSCGRRRRTSRCARRGCSGSSTTGASREQTSSDLSSARTRRSYRAFAPKGDFMRNPIIVCMRMNSTGEVLRTQGTANACARRSWSSRSGRGRCTP